MSYLDYYGGNYGGANSSSYLSMLPYMGAPKPKPTSPTTPSGYQGTAPYSTAPPSTPVSPSMAALGATNFSTPTSQRMPLPQVYMPDGRTLNPNYQAELAAWSAQNSGQLNSDTSNSQFNQTFALSAAAQKARLDSMAKLEPYLLAMLGGGSSGGFDGGGPPTVSAPSLRALIDAAAWDPEHLTAADRAAETGAKENIGQNLQAGVRDADAAMAERGISGSGIHSAALKGLVSTALGQGAETDRSLVKQHAARKAQLEDEQFAADARAAEANGQIQASWKIAQANAANQRLSTLLQFYGQAY